MCPADRDAVITDSGSLALLGHPGERREITKHGFTFSEALRQGRYVSCRFYVCLDCGGFYERREITRPGGQGCLPGVLCGIIIGMITATLSDSLALTIVAFFGVFIPVKAATDRMAAWHWKPRTESSGFTVKDAPCGCNQLDLSLLVPLDQAVGRDPPLRCSTCDRESLVFRIVGIS